MFDLGWSELAFLAVLALIVVGPKDLPKLIHGVGKLVGRAQRFYRESMFSLRRLENEIDVASARKDGKPVYYDLLPEHVRAMVAAESIATESIATGSIATGSIATGSIATKATATGSIETEATGTTATATTATATTAIATEAARANSAATESATALVRGEATQTGSIAPAVGEQT